MTLGTNAAFASNSDTDIGPAAATDSGAPDGDAPQGRTAVGEWTITTTGGQGRTVRFGELPDTMAGQQRSARAVARSWWDGQCGSNSSTADKYDVIKQYNRPKVHKRMEGSKSKMYCGKNVSTQSESAFGLRHIRAGHERDFAKLGALQGRDWGNFMHWSVSWVIREPGWRTVQSKKRYCYQKGFEFRSPNGSSFKRQVVVILGRTGVRIMTAFPTKNSDYCDGTRI